MIDKTVSDREISIPLLRQNLALAKKLARYQPLKEKSQQVYLNTLAVCAVNNYLRILGISTDLKASNSQNPVVCLAENIADLKITGKGFLECRTIEPNSINCYVPEEVRSDRIAYVVVEIDLAANQATLLGFSPSAENGCLNLKSLRSIIDFPVYLSRYQPLVNLSRWLESNIFEPNWLAIESVLSGSNPQFAFRFELVRRCKKILFSGQKKPIFLIVSLQDKNETIDIFVEICQTAPDTYLPPNLEIILLDSEDEKVMEARSKSENKKIQFEFSGEKGDRFSIKLVKNNVIIREDFIV